MVCDTHTHRWQTELWQKLRCCGLSGKMGWCGSSRRHCTVRISWQTVVCRKFRTFGRWLPVVDFAPRCVPSVVLVRLCARNVRPRCCVQGSAPRWEAGRCGAFILGPCVGCGSPVLQRQDVLSELTLGSLLTRRLFLNWTGSPMVGTCVLLMCRIQTSDASPLQKRMLCSETLTTKGAVLGLPCITLDERAVCADGEHALHPNQRGSSFYLVFFKASGIPTPGQLCGLELFDTTFVEVDAGVGDVLKVLGDVPRPALPDSPSESPSLLWAGGFCSGQS